MRLLDHNPDAEYCYRCGERLSSDEFSGDEPRCFECNPIDGEETIRRQVLSQMSSDEPTGD